ncbi:MAG: lamin tail domain-containing protein [Bacteroidales bacterium]|nr:lamin tail domain-containing protein [Bacteroidales bacterium]
MKKKITLLFVFGVISALSFGQIFITELADPNDNTSARYVELFNAGDSQIDLNTGYGLRRYTNDGAAPQATIYLLTGVIPAKGFYIVSNNATAFEAAYGFAPNQDIGASGPADGNGDDKILLVLVGLDTAVIDLYGTPGILASGTCEWYQDGRAERKASVTTGNGGTWNEANWNIWGDLDATGCTSFVTLPVNTTDGIYDPGQWIGYVPPNTIISFESLTSEINEDGTTIDVCVSITNPDASNATTVDVNISDVSTAINGSDYSSITFPVTLTFPAGSADNQCLSFTITDDTEAELGETVVLNLENPAGGLSAELSTQIQHTLVIIDNDIVCPNVGDLIISEVMQNPNAVSDADGEWFEVYNTTDSDIDLFGIEFTDDLPGVEKFVVDQSLIVSGKAYLLFAVNGDPLVNGGLPTPDFVYPTDPLLTLANAVDGIKIVCRASVIDSVIWDDGATFPDPTGASMSLNRDHLNSVDNDNGANWELATTAYGNGDLGTPGEANSTVSVKSNKISDFTLYPNPVSEGVFSINFTHDASRSIQIYSLIGKELYNKSYINNEQIIVSDLSAGLYILTITEEGISESHKLIIQ